MRRLAVLLLVVAALGAGCGSAHKAVKLHGTPLNGTAAPSFRLHDERGSAVSLASLRGNYVYVTFLYTHCPDVCPLIATNLALVLRNLPPSVENVRAIAISVDPQGDTPASVRRFRATHRLPRSFEYLIGSRTQLQRVWKTFHIAAQAGPENTINHSAYTLLVDPQGKELALYDAQVRPNQALADLRALSG